MSEPQIKGLGRLEESPQRGVMLIENNAKKTPLLFKEGRISNNNTPYLLRDTSPVLGEEFVSTELTNLAHAQHGHPYALGLTGSQEVILNHVLYIDWELSEEDFVL